MSKEQIYEILNRMKKQQAKLNDKKRLLLAFESKRGVSSSGGMGERVQKSSTQETTQNMISDRIIELERDITVIESEDMIEFYELATSEMLDDREQLIIMLYYGENLSYRQTARELFVRRNINPHHDTIREWIDLAVYQLSDKSDTTQ